MKSGTVPKYSEYFDGTMDPLKEATIDPSDELIKDKLKKQYGYCIKNSIIQNDDPDKCKQFFDQCVEGAKLKNLSVDQCKQIINTLGTEKIIRHQALFGPRLGSDGKFVDQLYNNVSDKTEIEQLYKTHKIIKQSVPAKNNSTSEYMTNVNLDTTAKLNFITDPDAITKFTDLKTTASSIRGELFLKELINGNYDLIWDNLTKIREYFKDSYNTSDKNNDLLRMLGPQPLPYGFSRPGLGIKNIGKQVIICIIQFIAVK